MNLVNGEQGDSLDIHDRALNYGDGLFETLAVHNGTALALEDHLIRLAAGATALGFPEPDAGAIIKDVTTIAGDKDRAVVKILLTRGTGGRGYCPPAIEATHPNRIVFLHDWPDYPDEIYEQGVITGLCRTRLSINPVLAGIKHLNRLEQVLARNEWRNTDVFEGLMLDMDGNLVEGTMTNLFLVIDDSLVTPSLENCGIHGIVRKAVMDATAEMVIDCRITRVTLEDLERASEVILCNSLLGLCHVRQFRNKTYDHPVLMPKLREMLIEQQKIMPL